MSLPIRLLNVRGKGVLKQNFSALILVTALSPPVYFAVVVQVLPEKHYIELDEEEVLATGHRLGMAPDCYVIFESGSSHTIINTLIKC